jgi:hypothetical protein
MKRPAILNSMHISDFYTGIKNGERPDFEQLERDVISRYGLKAFRKVKSAKYPEGRSWLDNVISAARADWACISAKSHRNLLNSSKPLVFRCYSGISKIQPFQHEYATRPVPTREGEQIQSFTSRSRNRLMGKARAVRREGLTMPYFITLTYHQNFTDCRAAKRHLDNFLKRWRRRCGSDQDGVSNLRYLWKMEPQKRGAIHFHLCVFLDRETRDKYLIFGKNRKEKSRLIQEMVSLDWAQVTREVDYLDIPGDETHPTQRMASIKHIRAGTNVRPCENWDMFTGYISKYISGKKDITESSFVNKETGELQPTGRFWGFSNNFDFSAIYEGIFYGAGKNGVKSFQTLAIAINDAAIDEFMQRSTAAESRAMGIKSEPRRMGQLRKIEKQREKQIRRYWWNLEKIHSGALHYLQFEAKPDIINPIIKQSEGMFQTSEDYYQGIAGINHFEIDSNVCYYPTEPALA